MSLRGSAGGPPFGVQPGPPDKAFIWNRSGATRALGDVMQLDLGQTATETTNNLVGDTASGFANGVLSVELQREYGIFFIVTGGALGDNQLMQVHFSGIIDANVSGANAAALYEPLTVTAGQDNLDSDVVTTEKHLGIVLVASAAGTEELIQILFDGWHGFGSTA